MPYTTRDIRRAATYQIIQAGAQALDDGLTEKALTALTIALALFQRSPLESKAEIATCQTLVGRCCLALGNHQTALDWFELAHPIHLDCDGPWSQSVSAAHSDQGTALLGLERYEEALAHFERSSCDR